MSRNLRTIDKYPQSGLNAPDSKSPRLVGEKNAQQHKVRPLKCSRAIHEAGGESLTKQGAWVRRTREALLVAVVGFCLLGLNSARGEDTNAITAATIAHDLGYKGTNTTYLLALMLTVDDRPLYLESALVAVKLPGNRWRLIHACRNPKDKAEANRRWRVRKVLDWNVAGSKDFKQRPTEPEVNDFLRGSLWDFHPLKDERLVYGEIYYDKWKEALGFECKYHIGD